MKHRQCGVGEEAEDRFHAINIDGEENLGRSEATPKWADVSVSVGDARVSSAGTNADEKASASGEVFPWIRPQTAKNRPVP